MANLNYVRWVFQGTLSVFEKAVEHGEVNGLYYRITKGTITGPADLRYEICIRDSNKIAREESRCFGSIEECHLHLTLLGTWRKAT